MFIDTMQLGDAVSKIPITVDYCNIALNCIVMSLFKKEQCNVSFCVYEDHNNKS